MHGRSWRRGLIVIGLVAVVAFLAYMGYAAYEGSRQLAYPTESSHCYTPGQLGWDYEAVNYNQADDARLASANPDMTHCTDQFAGTAGDGVVSRDGIRLAGWFIPAVVDADPAAPTILLVHGSEGNKSDMLYLAETLHDRYDLVVMDLRAAGRSSGTQHTLGLLEQYDVEAMVDWLAATKNPSHIAVLGVSAGAAASLALAPTDSRVQALILDSVYARSETVVAQSVATAGHPPYPATWAILLGSWIRTGHDIGSMNPIDALPSLGGRPILLLHGTADTVNVPAESVELIDAEARRLGLDVTLTYCDGAEHAAVVADCHDQYGTWVADFLTRVFPADH
jgi:uncharacterized protein